MDKPVRSQRIRFESESSSKTLVPDSECIEVYDGLFLKIPGGESDSPEKSPTIDSTQYYKYWLRSASSPSSIPFIECLKKKAKRQIPKLSGVESSAQSRPIDKMPNYMNEKFVPSYKSPLNRVVFSSYQAQAYHSYKEVRFSIVLPILCSNFKKSYSNFWRSVNRKFNNQYHSYFVDKDELYVHIANLCITDYESLRYCKLLLKYIFDDEPSAKNMNYNCKVKDFSYETDSLSHTSSTRCTSAYIFLHNKQFSEFFKRVKDSLRKAGLVYGLKPDTFCSQEMMNLPILTMESYNLNTNSQDKFFDATNFITQYRDHSLPSVDIKEMYFLDYAGRILYRYKDFKP